MDKLTNGWKQKAVVRFGPAGNVRPVDQYATQFRSFLGNLIKVTTKAPIYEWREVMRQYEQHLWTIITVTQYSFIQVEEVIIAIHV